MIPACLIWLVWQERNNHIFEDNERPFDLLKPLLFYSLFQCTSIWGFTQCISISSFLQSVSFSSWAFCIYFMSKVFIIVNTMFISFNKSLTMDACSSISTGSVYTSESNMFVQSKLPTTPFPIFKGKAFHLFKKIERVTDRIYKRSFQTLICMCEIKNMRLLAVFLQLY